MSSGYASISPFGAAAWRDPVDTAASLPLVGNALGDARAAEDTGVIYVWNGSSWVSPSGSGTVTSVGLTDSTNIFNVSGSPVTGAGALTIASLKNQLQNRVLASPNGSTGAPTFRALVSADIPTLNQNTTGSADSISGTNTIVNSNLAQMAANTLKGNNTGSSANAADLTASEVNTLLGTITSLTGAITAAGPGTTSSTLAVTPHSRYIDFVSGNDSTGNGSLLSPWKTLQHAYDNSSPTINEPYTFYLSGGNNDTDSAITAKPNVTLTSEYPIQVASAFTISGGSTNDTVTYNNITFLSDFTWSRNDASILTISMNNTQVGGVLTIKQAGAGSILFIGNRLAATGVTEFQAGANGAILMDNCTFFGGSFTFDDAPNSAYYEFLAGYLGEPVTINGGAYVYFSGVQADVPFGYTLTSNTTANGTPVIQSDSGSIPPSISGAYSLSLTSYAQHSSYAPADTSKWVNPQPTTVKEAIDRIAAVVGNGTPIP